MKTKKKTTKKKIQNKRKYNLNWKSFKHFYTPYVKSYTIKLVYVLFYGLLYTLLLRLFHFELTFLNYLTGLATYFIVQDLGYYLQKLTNEDKK